MRKGFRTRLAAALVLAVACRANAQVLLVLRFEHRQVLRFEAVNAFVTVYNEGNKPIVFSEDQARMSFTVGRERDEQVQVLNEDLLWRSVTIEPGKRREFMHDLSLIYDLAATGTYAVNAVVKWGGSEFQSKGVRIDVVNGLPISRERRVFPGETAEGYARVLSLRYLGREGSEHLFFCVDDEEGGRNFGVFDLGRIIRLHPPALRVKRDGATRILHQSGVGRHTLSLLQISESRVSFLDQQYRRADGSPFPKTGEPGEPGADRAPEPEKKRGKRRFFFFGPRKTEPGTTGS